MSYEALLLLPPFHRRKDWSLRLEFNSLKATKFGQGWSWNSQQCFQHFAMQECLVWFSSVQSLHHVWLFATPWTTAQQASLSITNSWSLPKLMSIELVMPSNHLILHCPLLLLPSIFPSIRVFSNESALGAGGQNTGVWALTSVLPVNTQDQFPLDELVGSPCSQRDSQESSPTPQFKSINSSVLSFL